MRSCSADLAFNVSKILLSIAFHCVSCKATVLLYKLEVVCLHVQFCFAHL